MNAITNPSITFTRDPFGNYVLIENFISELDGSQKDISHLTNYIAKIIRHPAMLLETFDTSLKRYYFAAIDWDHTILVGVRYKNGTWIVTRCFEDPSGRMVGPIFRRSNQLI